MGIIHKPEEYININSSAVAMHSSKPALVHDYLTALGLTFSNEFGDRTFIICALLSAQKERSVVLVALISIAAILCVNSFAVAVVYVAECAGFTQLKESEDYMQILIGAISLSWGLVNVVMYLWNLKKKKSKMTKITLKTPGDDLLPPCTRSSLSISLLESDRSAGGPHRSLTNLLDVPTVSTRNITSRRDSMMTRDNEELEGIIDSLRGETVTDVIKVVFPMIFLSELGDKSMLTTVLLASTFSLPAVCLGVMSGILLCIPLAACLGYAFSQYLKRIDFDLMASVMMILIGAVLLICPAIF